VRGRPTYVLQSLAGSPTTSIAESFVRLLFLLNGLRDAGASQRIVIIPYLAYARKDRRTQLRDPVNTRYVAQLLEASGADRLIALDVHNPAALDNAFRIPVDHLTALPMMADHFSTGQGSANLVVVSPDVGGVKRAQVFQELLEARLGRSVDLAFIEKRRASGKVSTGRLVGDVGGRAALIVDDLCATGGTLIRAAERCREAGAIAVHVAVSHTPYAEGLEAVLTSGAITDVLATDSVGIRAGPAAGRKLITLSVAALLGQAMRRMLSGKPLAPLLTHWPVPADG
jgi:ribose-phosphate pyrophosphokinase